MHACGHDTHITAMVGTARRLVAMKDQWKGTVLFIVQPARNASAAPPSMMKDGLYTRFPSPIMRSPFTSTADTPTGKMIVTHGCNILGG